MSKRSLKSLHTYITEEEPSEKELLKFIATLANENEPSERTITVRYSTFKKHVRENHPDYSDEFLKQIRPPTELTQKIIAENTERKMSRKTVDFDEKMVEKIKELKDSISPYQRAIYLEFVSGRRINEIFDAPLRVSKAKPREISMVLSKKGKDDKGKYSKFQLMKDTVDNQEFARLLKKMRTSVTGVSVADFTSRVNREMKKLFPKKNLSSHDLRAMSAIWSFHNDNDDKQNMIGYINSYLNHNPDSIGSSMAYSNINFVSG